MPQIAQLSETFASQIFWVLLFFGLVFFVIGKGMVPKVMATVDARDASVAADLKAAEAARAEADARGLASEPGKGSDFTLWLPLADTRIDAGTGEPIGKVA